MTLAPKTRPAPPPTTGARYDQDLYTWAREQGALMRAGRVAEVDWANVAEEIESLSRQEYHRLVSFYRLTLLHMLKWEHQLNHRSGIWATSIRIHREHAADVLAQNPGLKPRLDEIFQNAYRGARLDAVQETGLRQQTFPETCPYTRDEMLMRPFAIDLS